MSAWKTLHRRTVWTHSNYFRFEYHSVQTPAGEIVPDWPILHAPDTVTLAALTPDGCLVCTLEPCYPAESQKRAPLWAVLPRGEQPLAVAQQLLKNLGLAATSWYHMGSHVVNPEYGAGRAHFFLAQGVERKTTPAPDSPEIILMNRSELEAALVSGDLNVLPWSTAAALALLYSRPK